MDGWTELTDVPPRHAMTVARCLGMTFDVGVIIKEAQLDTRVYIWAQGVGGEDVSSEQQQMIGFCNGVVAALDREAKLAKAGSK